MNKHQLGKAIIFDLYGTLLHFDQRAFLRELQGVLQSESRSFDRKMLRLLLVQRYDSRQALLHTWCNAIGVVSPTVDQVSACNTVIEKHLSRIRPFPGTLTLLAFFKRRGFKLALLSNAAQTFTSALDTCGLRPFFDCVAFSCDLGLTKPDSRTYLYVCQGLGVSPEDCIFIGDSLENDFRAPSALGMLSLCLRFPASPLALQPVELSQLAWYQFDHDSDSLKRMLSVGSEIRFDNDAYSITSLITLGDDAQGRYNIVGQMHAKSATGEERTFYCKRYLSPESAHVEELAYRVVDILSPHGCRAALLTLHEPLLITTAAPGRLWTAPDMDETTAELIGSHCAVAYLIANADLRPRNTFMERNGERTTLSIIDLEHCFFDRALDLRGIDDPMSPLIIDGLSHQLEERTKHRVLSPAATRRARRSFLPNDDQGRHLGERFKQGWIALFERARGKLDAIEALLMDRIYTTPYLIIGTQSYRRAMALSDVGDISQRIREDPIAAFDHAY